MDTGAQWLQRIGSFPDWYMSITLFLICSYISLHHLVFIGYVCVILKLVWSPECGKYALYVHSTHSRIHHGKHSKQAFREEEKMFSHTPCSQQEIHVGLRPVWFSALVEEETPCTHREQRVDDWRVKWGGSSKRRNCRKHKEICCF